MSVFVTAPTGIAACNVGGTTLNSFAGVGLGKETADHLAMIVCSNERTARKWRQARVLVIDEVSMLDGKLFDKLDYVARRARNEETKPFGGIQLIMCGDFYQLPPVGIDQNASFCFEAKVWPRLILPSRQLVLRKIFRQSDECFVKCLNELRCGRVSAETTRALTATKSNQLSHNRGASGSGQGAATEGGGDGSAIEPTRLYSHNADVDRENDQRLRRLSGKTMTYEAYDTGSAAAKRLLQNCSCPEHLKLKMGAQVRRNRLLIDSL
jgi:ATP-dependent DNA helicase PIF1